MVIFIEHNQSFKHFKLTLFAFRQEEKEVKLAKTRAKIKPNRFHAQLELVYNSQSVVSIVT